MPTVLDFDPEVGLPQKKQYSIDLDFDPSIAYAAKPSDPKIRVFAIIGVTLLVAGISGLIKLWKSGKKKLAAAIWIIIAVWFIFSIAYKL
jgi:hypothetical protein